MATPPAYSRAYCIASALEPGSVTQGSFASTSTVTASAPWSLSGRRTMPELITRIGPFDGSLGAGTPNTAHAGSGLTGGGLWMQTSASLRSSTRSSSPSPTSVTAGIVRRPGSPPRQTPPRPPPPWAGPSDSRSRHRRTMPVRDGGSALVSRGGSAEVRPSSARITGDSTNGRLPVKSSHAITPKLHRSLDDGASFAPASSSGAM